MNANTDRPRVVAGIVNYNGATLTVAAVDSLFGQAEPGQLRIVIVDNASEPADLDALETRTGGRASVVRLTENRGYAAACNAVSHIAADTGADYVWWLNNDLRLEPGALRALVHHLDANPRSAAAAPVLVDYETGARALGAGMDLSLWRGRVRHRYAGMDVEALPPGAEAEAEAEAEAVEILAGACVLVRISALRVIGGMDEAYFMYGEDVDWSIRARIVGFDLDVVYAARARHGWARSSQPADRMRYILRNRIRLVRVHGGRLVQLAFLTYFLLGWLPAYALARLVPRFGLRRGLGLAFHPLAWNVGDAVKRRRWRLRLEDQAIPRI